MMIVDKDNVKVDVQFTAPDGYLMISRFAKSKNSGDEWKINTIKLSHEQTDRVVEIIQEQRSAEAEAKRLEAEENVGNK